MDTSISEEVNFLNPASVEPQLKELTPEQRTFIEEKKADLNLRDSTAVMQYGAPVQTKISKFSDSVLQNVRTKNTGEIGKDLTNLVTTIKDFDTDAEKKPRFALFRNAKNRMDKLIVNYSSVESNIDKVVSSLEGHQRQLLKDVNMLDMMYNNNYDYFKELTLYILAGEEKLEEFRNVDIPQQQQVAQATSDQMEIQKLNDMQGLASRFEKKLHDLNEQNH